MLAASPFDEFAGTASKLLDPRQAIEIQLTTVEAIRAVDHPDAAGLLLTGFSSYTPRVRAAVMDAVFARRERLLVLLQAIERGDVPGSSLDAVRRDQLMNDSNMEIAALARRLLSTDLGAPTRQGVLAEYAQSLKQPRNPARGKAVFEKQCAKCHRLGDQGYEVGPDLLTAKTRADATWLSDVLDPSNQITVGYNQYTVITVNGRVFTGILASETPSSITLRAEEKKDTTILRKHIDEMVASTVSMMPEDLEKEVTVQDVADLLGFLRQTLGSAQPNQVVLFDDE